MPPDARAVATAIAERNAVGAVARQPKRMQQWADEHPVHIYNVSPYPIRYEHPLVGVLTIKGCEPGESYSEPCIVKGLLPHGVRLEMKGVEIRQEDGKEFVLDILQLGFGQRTAESPVHMGLFVAAKDTFDLKKPLDWLEEGECGTAPTKKELADANARFLKWDSKLIADGDRHWGEGPTQPTSPHMGHGNITVQMREACTRRGQNRPWNQDIKEMAECPGCSEQIRPGVIVHTCGAVLDWDKAIALGMKREEDRPSQTYDGSTEDDLGRGSAPGTALPKGRKKS